MLEPEIYVSSEVDARLDDLTGDIVIMARGQDKARLTLSAAEVLYKRLGEAITNSQELPLVKKVIPSTRKRPDTVSINRNKQGRFT